jgi:hypothetical protein
MVYCENCLENEMLTRAQISDLKKGRFISYFHKSIADDFAEKFLAYGFKTEFVPVAPENDYYGRENMGYLRSKNEVSQ